jgi:hypothetical protein
MRLQTPQDPERLQRPNAKRPQRFHLLKPRPSLEGLDYHSMQRQALAGEQVFFQPTSQSQKGNLCPGTPYLQAAGKRNTGIQMTTGTATSQHHA